MLPKLARAAWFIAKQWPRAGQRGRAMLDTQNGGVAGTAAGAEGGGHSAQFSFRSDTEREPTNDPVQQTGLTVWYMNPDQRSDPEIWTSDRV